MKKKIEPQRDPEARYDALMNKYEKACDDLIQAEFREKRVAQEAYQLRDLVRMYRIVLKDTLKETFP